MHCKGVDHDWGPLLRGLVAEALNQNQDGDGLLVRESCVDRNIHIVGVHRDIRRYDTVEW
jgi:hypothetical protein